MTDVQLGRARSIAANFHTPGDAVLRNSGPMTSLPSTLMTSRPLLRRWSVDHLDEVMKATEASIDSLRQWMPWAADGVPSRVAELHALEAGIADFDSDADWQFSTFERVSGTLVGGCGLHRTAKQDRLEIGYWTQVDHQGLGYATEAAAGLVDAAFLGLGWANQIRVRMDVANVGSARVPDKLGFRLIGEERRPIVTSGHTGRGLVWSLDRSEWCSDVR